MKHRGASRALEHAGVLARAAGVLTPVLLAASSCGGEDASGPPGTVSGGAGADRTGVTAGAEGQVEEGAAGGARGDPFEATVVPTQTAEGWALSFGTTVFEVEPDDGGRVVTCSIDGENVLVSSGAAYGSSFWPSPQSVWPGSWPPPPEFDSDAFAASTEGNVIVLAGTTTTAAFGNLRATKRFWANQEHQVVTVEYTIHNDGAAAVSVAGWENSRVDPGGLTFFPQEQTDRWSFGAFDPVPIESAAGAGWFQYHEDEITADSKSGADGSEGWAAHVHCHAALERPCTGGARPVFIKQFSDVAAAEFAPGEAEIELFTNGGHSFVEFELQGPYASIPAGGEQTWRVHWYLRSLPATSEPVAGNTELLDFVRSQLL